MIEAWCTNMFRNKDGRVQYIRLVDSQGRFQDMEPRYVRSLINKGKLKVPNLRIEKNKAIRMLYQ